MAHSKLSREHSLALLNKLATDDDFRRSFQEKPAKALADLGVPHSTVVDLNPACLAPPSILADKGDFVSASRDLAGASSDACLTMVVPGPKFA